MSKVVCPIVTEAEDMDQPIEAMKSFDPGGRKDVRGTLLIFVICALLAVPGSLFANSDGKSTKDPAKEEITLEFRLVHEGPGKKAIEVPNRKTGKTIYVSKKVALSNEDIEKVEVVPDLYMDPEVAIFFTKEGKRKLTGITQNNVGRRMALLLNGEVITAPTIRSRIASGRLVIAGEFEENEVDELVEAFNKGDGVMTGSGAIHEWMFE
jgi:preprotein translocase subunit SecD